MNQQLRDTTETFWCPSGHRQSYAESEVDRLKRQLTQRGAQIDQLQAAVRFERERVTSAKQQTAVERRRTIAQKAAKTRLKNRVSKGACICCNRFFKNLAAHMQTQHPELVQNPESDAADETSAAVVHPRSRVVVA